MNPANVTLNLAICRSPVRRDRGGAPHGAEAKRADARARRLKGYMS